MKMIEANKVVPLIRLILLDNPNIEKICKGMQDVVNIHTIEAEPIVRCKECIYWNSGENECDKWEHCILHNIGIGPDSFCSYGKRKEGADNG